MRFAILESREWAVFVVVSIGFAIVAQNLLKSILTLYGRIAGMGRVIYYITYSTLIGVSLWRIATALIINPHKKRRSDQIKNGTADFLATRGLENRMTPSAGRIAASVVMAHEPSLLQFFVDGGSWAWATFSESLEYESMRLRTIVMMRLNNQSPHIYFDCNNMGRRSPGNFRRKLDNAVLVPQEGIVSSSCKIYAPKGYHLDSLVIAAPDLLNTIVLNRYGADVECMDTQLYFIFPGEVDIKEHLDAILASMQTVARELEDNLSAYKDEREISSGIRVGYDGQRLIRE